MISYIIAASYDVKVNDVIELTLGARTVDVYKRQA